MEPSEDRIPIGVPIQVVAYTSTEHHSSEETSALKVNNSRQIRSIAPSNSKEDEVNLDVDYVFQHCGEGEVMDRSLNALVAAAMDGVNACLYSAGSSNTSKTTFTQGETSSGALGLAGAMIECLYEMVQEREMLASGARGEGGGQYHSFIRISFLEFYEEMITDLMNPTNKSLAITETPSRSIYVKNAKRMGPLRHVDDAMDVLKQGRKSRNTSDNAHGSAKVFTSTLLKIEITQVTGSVDQGQSIVLSSLQIVEMPATERLSRSPATVRLAEGPLLNKTLHAVDAVVRCLSREQHSEYPPYGDSHLTQLIRNSMGGNCISLVVLFLTEDDFEGSSATLNLGRMMQGCVNYPIINSEMMQGLSRRQTNELIFLREEMETIRDDHNASSSVGANESVLKIKELEGKLLQERMEGIHLKKEKEKIVRTVAEFRAKYQQLVENKSDIQKTLIETEEQKLNVSKALLDLQLENNGLMEKAEQEKYEIVTKLLNAENDILELEMREESKEARIKTLEEELTKALEEKKELAMEFVSLKTNFMNLSKNNTNEVAKNQQLGVELLTLANQKKSLLKRTEDLEKYKKDMIDTQSELRVQIDKSTLSEQQLKDKLRSERETSEKLRSEKAKAELELQSAVVNFETKKLDLDKNTQDFARERDTEIFSLKKTMENELLHVQNQKDAQVDQLKRLEANIRTAERRIKDFETATHRKNEENSDLTTLNARLNEQLQTQEDNYRTKLLKYMDFHQLIDGDGENEESEPKRNSVLPTREEGHGESEGPTSKQSESIEVMREGMTHELVETFKIKERESTTALDGFRRKNHDLIRKNRLLYEKFKQIRYLLEDQSPTGTELPDLPEESELKAGDVSELEAEIEKELLIMKEKLRHVQDELSLQQEKNLQTAEGYKSIVVQLEKNNGNLNESLTKITNERDRYENDVNRLSKSTTAEDDHNAASIARMKEMQETLLIKIKELQENSTEKGAIAASNRDSSAEVMVLKRENKSLVDKLKEAQNNPSKNPSPSRNENQGVELEDAERRCAELMTKNVMVTEELEVYKKHMKKTTSSLQQRIRQLENQIKGAA